MHSHASFPVASGNTTSIFPAYRDFLDRRKNTVERSCEKIFTGEDKNIKEINVAFPLRHVGKLVRFSLEFESVSRQVSTLKAKKCRSVNETKSRVVEIVDVVTADARFSPWRFLSLGI